MKVVVIQNKVYENVDVTIKEISYMLSTEDLRNIDFLVFPEMFTTPYETKYIEKNKQDINSTEINFLRKQAIKYNCYVIGGSIPYLENDKLYNTCFVFNRTGKIIKRYNKMHLFEVTYPNGKHYKESEIFTPGKDLGVFETEFGKFGLMICFDIRFPELSEKLLKEDVKAVFVPAAFNTFTGPMHWEVTFRARAIDNQIFFIGSSPSADSFGKYNVYGHSIITNPLGKVVANLEDKPGIIIKEIDLNDINKARKTIPIVMSKLDWS